HGLRLLRVPPCRDAAGHPRRQVRVQLPFRGRPVDPQRLRRLHPRHLAVVGADRLQVRVLIHAKSVVWDGRGNPAVPVGGRPAGHILDPWKTPPPQRPPEPPPPGSPPSTPGSSRAAAWTCCRARRSRACATPPPAACMNCCAAARWPC